MAAAELNDSGEDALELGSDEDEEEEEKDWAAMRNTEAWLYQSGELSDVEVSAGGRVFRLHKFVLCRESVWFRENLMGPEQNEEPTVDLEEDDFDGLCQMMYVGGLFGETFEDTVVARMKELGILPERCLRICLAAMELGCGQVVLCCEYFFDKMLDTNTAIFFLKGSWGIPGLKYFQANALALMVKSFENYLGDENIGFLQVEALCKVMKEALQRKPQPPPQRVFCSVAVRNLVFQDQQREVNRTNIKMMLALLPVVNYQDVCDLLQQCSKHGAEQETERCTPVLASSLPDVERVKALAMSRKVILNVLRHEALSDIDHAYVLGKEFLLKEVPELEVLVDVMDKKGTVPSQEKTKRPRVGTEEWYALEILDTLAILRNRIRKKNLEASRNLPSFRVLLICAEHFEEYREDVRLKLVKCGCTQVDVVLAHLRNPSFETLLTYHSVMVWSNANFHAAEALGDVLADAADEGVGVVICCYSMKEADEGVGISGRIVSYLPCTFGYVQGGEELTLQPNTKQLQEWPKTAPIMEGVEKLSGGPESMHLSIEKKIGVFSAVTVANWSNRVPAVVVNLAAGKRQAAVVVWNCRPGSSAVSQHGWVESGHGMRLMFNMLRFATATPTDSKCMV